MTQIFQFVLIAVALISGIAAMIRAGDSGAVRRLSAILAVGTIFFSEELADLATVLFGAALETFVAAVGVGFFIVLCLTLMLTPIFFAIHKCIH